MRIADDARLNHSEEDGAMCGQRVLAVVVRLTLHGGRRFAECRSAFARGGCKGSVSALAMTVENKTCIY